MLSRQVDFHVFSAVWLNTPSLANSSALKEHINHIGLFRKKEEESKSEVSHEGNGASGIKDC